MPTYEITLHETYHVTYTVEADDVEDAKIIVQDGGGDCNDPAEWEYCTTDFDALDEDYDIRKVKN